MWRVKATQSLTTKLTKQKKNQENKNKRNKNKKKKKEKRSRTRDNDQAQPKRVCELGAGGKGERREGCAQSVLLSFRFLETDLFGAARCV